MFNFSTEEFMNLVDRLLTAIKNLFAWLGILILPNEEEAKDYPTTAAPEE